MPDGAGGTKFGTRLGVQSGGGRDAHDVCCCAAQWFDRREPAAVEVVIPSEWAACMVGSCGVVAGGGGTGGGGSTDGGGSTGGGGIQE